MTHLCAPIFVTELAKARRDIAAARAAGADMVELRIDLLRDLAVVPLLLEDRILPAIVTCRSVQEGGHSTLPTERRMEILAEALHNGAQLVDLELQSIEGKTGEALFHEISPRLILSFHNFTGKPVNLAEIAQRQNQVNAHVNKIVWRCSEIVENFEALKLLKDPARPTIAICMGEAGLMSRVLAKKFGAFLTFASLDSASATAPGQVTVTDLKYLYRWDAIGTATKVYGVIGHPIAHSLSPAIHNAAFTASGHDGVYLPFFVEPDYAVFRKFVDSLRNFAGMNLNGLSVTIPHKENALRYLKETGGAVEELAERIGAVNTIVIGPAGLSGMNTDYAAILDSITSEMNIDRARLAGLRVSILGAGGTARAAVAGLAHYGASVTISNRTGDRATALAAEFDGRSGKVAAVTLDELCTLPCDVLINTTSVGMHPNIAENPFGDRPLPVTKKTIVFDTIYNPLITTLLTKADTLGAKTISGVEMFIRQAGAQFQAWTGLAAPTGVMRRVIADRIGLPVHHR
jgi:3-dehydroquinate dehydratase/shikimate dehydrogenase